ncbi:MAG: tRNA pseudouridine(55) synthase TruB [Bacteroidetes bacterium]|nr:tRNA pseudouridine(55) synthase TruB [Bacteroidota bacterium]
MSRVTLEGLREGSVLLFDKPLYWTSFDLVNKVRGVLRIATGEKKIKVGHAGTLDPLATGLMIVCTGKKTKTIETLTGLDKEYLATIRLGSTTPSFDLETEVNSVYGVEHITDEMILPALLAFEGEQLQVPPVFSAKYIEGKRSYELARKGIHREPAPVRVTIKKIEMLGYSGNDLLIRVLCSKGTYIRSLARDIGVALGSGGHLTGLRRTAIGDYVVGSAVSPPEFENFVTLMKQSPS